MKLTGPEDIGKWNGWHDELLGHLLTDLEARFREKDELVGLTVEFAVSHMPHRMVQERVCRMYRDVGWESVEFFAKEYETFRPRGGMSHTTENWFIRFTKKPEGPKLGPFR